MSDTDFASNALELMSFVKGLKVAGYMVIDEARCTGIYLEHAYTTFLHEHGNPIIIKVSRDVNANITKFIVFKKI